MQLALIETVKSIIIKEIDNYLTNERSKYYNADAKQIQDCMNTLKEELRKFNPDLPTKLSEIKNALTGIIKYNSSQVHDKSNAIYCLGKVSTILDESFNSYNNYGFALVTQEQLDNSIGLKIVNKLINEYLLIKAVERQHANDSLMSISLSFVNSQEISSRKKQLVETLISEIQKLEYKLFKGKINNDTYQNRLSLRLHQAKAAVEKERSGGILIPLLEKLIEDFPNTIAKKINTPKTEISFTFLIQKSNSAAQSSKERKQEKSEEEKPTSSAETTEKKNEKPTSDADAIAKTGVFASTAQKKPVEQKPSKNQQRKTQRAQNAASLS